MKNCECANFGDVQVMEVIVTTLLRYGDGKASPIRRITQIWCRHGGLIADIDPCPPTNS